MSLARFSPVQPQDNRQKGLDAPSMREFVDLGQNLARSLKRVLECPLLDGRLIQGVSFTAATRQDLEHGLGRNYVGFLVVRCSAATSFDENYSGTTVDRTKFISLQTASDCTADFWVF
jgi:hypothetical protein